MTSFLIENLLKSDNKSISSVSPSSDAEQQNQKQATTISSSCQIASFPQFDCNTTRHVYSKESYTVLHRQHYTQNHPAMRGSRISPVDCFCKCDVCSCFVCYDWFSNVNKQHLDNRNRSTQSSRAIFSKYQERGMYELPSLTYVGHSLRCQRQSYMTPSKCHYTRTSNSVFRRRHRTIFSDEQLQYMEHVFSNTQYPDVLMREDIARVINLTEEKVEVWFKNRRARFRKQKKDFPLNSPGNRRTSSFDYHKITKVSPPPSTGVTKHYHLDSEGSLSPSSPVPKIHN